MYSMEGGATGCEFIGGGEEDGIRASIGISIDFTADRSYLHTGIIAP